MSTNLDFIETDNYQDVPNISSPLEQQPSSLVPINHGPIFSFYIIFKAIPFILYIFGWILFSSMFQWVAIIVTSAIDFWYTKNIAGRLIVGLFWSNRVDNQGKSQWIFEHSNNYGDKSTVNAEHKGQKRTFWISLYGSSIVWCLFSFFSIIRLKPGWLMCSGISASLALVNAWGFNKCDGDSKQYLKNSIFGDGLSSMIFDKAKSAISSTIQNS